MNCCGIVGSRQSAVGRNVACGDVIGYRGTFGAVASTGLRPSSRKSQVVSFSATLLVIGILVYWEHLRRYLSYLISDNSSSIKKIALQSNAIQNSSLLTPHSSLNKGLLSDNSPVYRILALPWAGMNSRFQKIALHSNAYQNSSLFTLHTSLKKGVAKQRNPKPFIIYHSSFTNSWDSNPTLKKLKKERCKATHTETPHSSLLTPHSFHRTEPVR